MHPSFAGLAFAVASTLALAGPTPKGTLVIAGGGKLPISIEKAFVEAAGGKGARIAILPTASEVPKESAEGMVVRFQSMGAVPVVVNPRTRAEAEAWGSRKDLATCTGFWFTGGDQNRIADLVGDTSLHRLILTSYQTGAAIGGTSAGAAIMSPLMLVGTDDVSDTAPGAYKTRAGLGLLPGCLVDQHFLRRSRHNRLLSLLMEHPELLGLGIDESTALLVRGGQALVVGDRAVLVFDPSGMVRSGDSFQDLRLHLLRPGQGIDLSTRQVYPR